MSVTKVALALILAAAASSANAAIAVLGPGPEHECFLAAKTGYDMSNGMKACNAALVANLVLSDKFATLINRGVIEYALKDKKSAFEDFAAGVALKPDGGDAYIDRGIILAMEKRFPEALEDFNKGIALHADNAYLGYYNRAIIEESAGDTKSAYQDYRQALTLEPKFLLAAEQLKRFKVVPASSENSPISSP